MPSTITFEFEGLLIFCFDQNKQYCHIGINDLDASNHQLSFQVMVGENILSGISITPSLLALSGSLWVYIDSGNGFKLENNTVCDDTPPLGKDSFSKVLALDGQDLARGTLLHSESKTIPSIYITHGNFYTQSTVSYDYWAVHKSCLNELSNGHIITRGRMDELNQQGYLRVLSRFANVAGAITILNNHQSLRLKIGDFEYSNFPFLSGAMNENITITIKNTDPNRPPDESRHFLKHYDFFDVSRASIFGLVKATYLDTIAGEGALDQQIECRNDGCNSVRLSDPNLMPESAILITDLTSAT
jgi:hypothetical protein